MKKLPAAVAEPVLSRAETAVPTPRLVIPDGCNMGTLLRVAVGVNLAAGGVALLIDPQAPTAPFLTGAALIEPVLLGTLLIWCLLRRALPPLAVEWQRAVAWLVPVALTWLLIGTFGLMGFGMHLGAQAAYLLAALVGGAATQHYLELRARAFSPAVAEARFQALQSRIRPHFFFNALNAVIAVVRADPRRAERMLESIAELLRAVMGDVRKLVPFEQELDLCRRYVEIEQTRLGPRLQVDWQIGAVHPRCRVPQLLLQPLIENAVRYGAEKIAGECDIVMRVRQHGFHLEVFISNPIAREPIQREGNQIGLANIRGRLALIYDLEAELETKVRRDRFELTLTLPVEAKA
ncbi:MAG TPA: histidine kinase [Burkholderiaceae bacterium]|nr:histidine kinase [Burkholderiaceae bacterium]